MTFGDQLNWLKGSHSMTFASLSYPTSLRGVGVGFNQTLATLAEKKAIDDDLKAALNGLLKEFGEQFAARKNAA